jgi:hypothetical protein
MAFPTFAETTRRLIAHRPPRDQAVADQLDQVRAAFDRLVLDIEDFVPEGPDAQIAARRIHDACQSVISAIVHGQAG